MKHWICGLLISLLLVEGHAEVSYERKRFDETQWPCTTEPDPSWTWLLALSAITWLSDRTCDLTGLWCSWEQDPPVTELIVTYKGIVNQDMVGSTVQTVSNFLGIIAILEHHHDHYSPDDSWYNNTDALINLNGAYHTSHLRALIDLLESDPDIKFVEPNTHVDLVAKVPNLPTDTFFSYQYNLNKGRGGANIVEAWPITLNTSNITIAVLDTGITNHTDLTRLLPGFDFVHHPVWSRDGNSWDDDPSDPGDWVPDKSFCYPINAKIKFSTWHGTFCGGIVCANTNNHGIAGITWESKLLPIRVFSSCGGDQDGIDKAINWAAGKNISGTLENKYSAHIISMSFRAIKNCEKKTQESIDFARSQNITLIASAGNDNHLPASYIWPANCQGVITVTSIDRYDRLPDYANVGPSVDIAAPGGGDGGLILSTSNSGLMGPVDEDYAFDAGTSFAAPHVSGVVALMYAVNPDITPDEVKEILMLTARPFPCYGNCQSRDVEEGWWPWLSDVAYRWWYWQYDCGEGILDGGAAVRETDRRYNHPGVPAQLPVQPRCPGPAASSIVSSMLGTAVLAGAMSYCIRHRGR